MSRITKCGPEPAVMDALACVTKAVAEAFANASDNGFSFEGATAEEITDDMMSFDADIEEMPRADVLAAVTAHLAQLKAEQQ